MTSSQLQEFARFGAQARLQAIAEERRAIVEAFPDLGRSSGSTNGAQSPATRERKGMSPSQRKAVGERMKAYWAKRRGEKAGTEGADTETVANRTARSANQPAKRKGMSPAARKAHGERMRAFWAARRAEKVAQSDGAQAEAGAGPSGKRKGSRKVSRKEPRKK
jgi:hypothetical protein